MSTQPPGSDLDRLRAAHPLWVIEAVWRTVPSGPDRRMLTARRAGVTVSAATAPELSIAIGEAERSRGWES